MVFTGFACSPPNWSRPSLPWLSTIGLAVQSVWIIGLVCCCCCHSVRTLAEPTRPVAGYGRGVRRRRTPAAGDAVRQQKYGDFQVETNTGGGTRTPDTRIMMASKAAFQASPGCRLELLLLVARGIALFGTQPGTQSLALGREWGGEGLEVLPAPVNLTPLNLWRSRGWQGSHRFARHMDRPVTRSVSR